MPVSRGARRATVPADLPSPPRLVGVDVGPLIIDVTFPPDRPFRRDLSGYPCPLVVRELAAVLVRRCEPGGGVASPSRADTYTFALRHFAAFLASRHPDRAPTLRLRDVAPDDLDGYERAVRERYRAGSTMPHELMKTTVALLRAACAAGSGAATPELEHRLRWVADGEEGTVTPRDAYSDRVVAGLKAACRADLRTTVRRLTVEGPALLAQGGDPRAGGWDNAANILWEIAQRGILSTRELRAQAGAGVARRRPVGPLHHLLYPSQRDLLALLILFSLETGMELECAKTLAVDCLKNPNRGYIEVDYLKRRAPGREWRRLRVRDGSDATPGGLLRLAMRLTQRIRETMAGDARLWLHYSGGACYRSSFVSQGKAPALQRGTDKAGWHLAQRFVADHDLRDDDDRPLHLQLARLRKTHAAVRYRRVGGRLPAFVAGHSPDVAARHYGDIPALRPTHEQAIADGLTDALDAALGRTVVPPEREALVAADPAQAPAVLGVPPAQAPALLGGERDLWLCACRDFFASPFGSAGQACPVPFWGCLDCENAVITGRKLPQILALLNHLERERERLDAAEWATLYGRSRERIVGQILPAFPEDMVLAARAVAEAEEGLLYLPVAGAGFAAGTP